MTYTELINAIKADGTERADHYISSDMKRYCRTCNTNLDYYYKIVDIDLDLKPHIKRVKCLRCGSTTVIINAVNPKIGER